MNKKEKRKIKEKDRGIVDIAVIVNHFFKDLLKWINEMNDPRQRGYIKYEQSDFIILGILKNICGVETMRQMDEKFNKENCIKTLKMISGDKELSEMPHYDTINYYLEKLSPECLRGLRKKMIYSLIRRKSFYKHRLLDKYWRIILDGTGQFYFKERHCENCLCVKRKVSDGSTRIFYYQKVLEAKIVMSNKVVLSLDTEFIEGEQENISKQDCGQNAGKRILSRIKKEYPRLPICIQGDALYATEPIMKICRENKWVYIFTHKGTRQRLLQENYELLEEGKDKYIIANVCQEKGEGKFANNVGKLAGKTEQMNILEYSFETKEKNGLKRKRMEWVTNIEITRRNLEKLITAGRGRWKIENEGFNNQKNGIYKISHINSRNSRAMKNHYLLTQISDIIMQLYLSWNKYIKEIKQSIKNTSLRLLESFRRDPIIDEDVKQITKYITIHLE